MLLGGRATILARRLARIVDARGSWIGIRDDDDPDEVMIDVLPQLVPYGALAEERLAAIAYYQNKKSFAIDGELVAKWFVGLARSRK